MYNQHWLKWTIPGCLQIEYCIFSLVCHSWCILNKYVRYSTSKRVAMSTTGQTTELHTDRQDVKQLCTKMTGIKNYIHTVQLYFNLTTYLYSLSSSEATESLQTRTGGMKLYNGCEYTCTVRYPEIHTSGRELKFPSMISDWICMYILSINWPVDMSA